MAPRRNQAQEEEPNQQAPAQPPADQNPGQPPVPPGQQGQQPPLFSLTPGLSNTGVLDYSTKEGKSHYKAATAKISEDLYDCSPEGFYQYLKSLEKRANEFGWSKPGGLLFVSPRPNATPKNLLEDYGQITLERIQQEENAKINQQNRRAQDDRMLFECIMNSLSTVGQAKVNIHEKEYMLGNPKLPSGLALLKVLIRESYLDSNATTGMIRTKLANLDSYMSPCGHDITKFNTYVMYLVQALQARGDTTTDLLTNLFRGCAACSDSSFVSYIADKQSEWEEGTKELTPQKLMDQAMIRYKILKSKEIWNAPSADQEKIMALEAQVSKLNQALKKRGKQSTTKEKGKESGKVAGNKRKQKEKERPSWMTTEPPFQDLRKPKMMDGKEWFWCSAKTGGKCPGIYRLHRPNQCRYEEYSKKPRTMSDKKARPFQKANKANNKPKVVIDQAVTKEDKEIKAAELQGGYTSEES